MCQLWRPFWRRLFVALERSMDGIGLTEGKLRLSMALPFDEDQ
jgi:hypothetical protein